MTDDDELRAQLAALDPVRRDSGLRSLSEATPAEIQELAMQTIDSSTTDQPAGSSPEQPRRGLRSPFGLVAGVVALATLAVGGYAVSGLGGDSGARTSAVSSPTPKPSGKPVTTLALKVSGGGGAVSASCIRFDPAILKAMPVAFLGTVVSQTRDVVTLHVDKWYVGGTQDQVTLAVPGGASSVALDGVDFSGGSTFLVTAAEDGTVNGCGYSGPTSPALEKIYADTFAG